MDQVQEAWNELMNLMVDLFYDTEPETETHLARRQAAINALRNA